MCEAPVPEQDDFGELTVDWPVAERARVLVLFGVGFEVRELVGRQLSGDPGTDVQPAAHEHLRAERPGADGRRACGGGDQKGMSSTSGATSAGMEAAIAAAACSSSLVLRSRNWTLPTIRTALRGVSSLALQVRCWRVP